MKKKHLRYGIGFRPAATLGDVQMAEMVIKPGGREGGAGNRHRGSDQWLLVIEGFGHARVNGKPTQLKAGHLLVIEKGEEHEVVNDGDVPLKTINVYSPPAYTAAGGEKPAVGTGVENVRVGDRVVIPFVIACGHCYFCDLTEYACCETTNTGPGAAANGKGIRPPAALFGYSHLYGGVPGGQAEFVRVPHANVGPFVVPGSLADEQVLFLSDILPTGYQAAQNAGVKPGSSVAIFGAGPVGLMAAASARMLGAERIFMIDHHAYRLAFAQQTYGVIPINFDEIEDPAQLILEQTAFRGVDASIDAVGFEAKGSTTETVMATLKLEGGSGEVLRQWIASTRRGGIVSIPGVYAGFVHAFLIGDAFDKGLSFRMGQTHVQRLLPELLDRIEDGSLAPDAIISHRMSLADAAEGYRLFNEKEEDCRKVVLVP